MINVKELETKGFVVVKNFLTSEQLEIAIQDYQEKIKHHIHSDSDNKNYSMLQSTSTKVKPWLTELLQTISQDTNLTINYIMPFIAYLDNQLVNFGWHQDHETYYQWQETYNSINCWVPIIKPNSHLSGLSIIPHDAWINKCPEIFKDHIFDKGATTFVKKENGTTDMLDHEWGKVINLPFDVDTLAVTPELNAGDALILRQDIVHRTQDTLDERVAFTIRCRNGDGVVNKNKLLAMCPRKQHMIENNKRWFLCFMEQFEKTDQLTIRELAESLISYTSNTQAPKSP
jgi:hypothetical protein